MFRQPSKKNKLKAKGGETRYLVPFAYDLTRQLAVSPGGPHWKAAAALFNRLHAMISAMAEDVYPHEAVAALSREYCCLYSGLETSCEKEGRLNCWSPKPQMNMMKELLEYTATRLGNPMEFWCFRDE
jgi:hypothetical protein